MTAAVTTQQAWGVEQRVALLTPVPLFAVLPPHARQELAQRFHPRKFPRSAFVFHEGQPADTVHIVAAGRLKTVRTTNDGHQIVLRLINPGELLGVASGWGGGLYSTSARTLDPTVVLQLPTQVFTDYLDRYPSLAQAVINDLGARLREAEERILDAESANVEMRLARALLRLTTLPTPAPPATTIALSRQDLGDLTGTTLSTASRVLSSWHRRGLIFALRERVEILDRAGLTSIAKGS